MTLPEKVASVTRESRIGWDFIGSSAAGGAAMGPGCARRQLWSWTSWAGICLLALAAWRVAEGVMAGEEPAGSGVGRGRSIDGAGEPGRLRVAGVGAGV